MGVGKKEEENAAGGFFKKHFSRLAKHQKRVSLTAEQKQDRKFFSISRTNDAVKRSKKGVKEAAPNVVESYVVEG